MTFTLIYNIYNLKNDMLSKINGFKHNSIKFDLSINNCLLKLIF